jgi:hypothetical protein
MKKNSFAPILIILLIAVLGLVVYSAYKNSTKSTPQQIEEKLIQITKVTKENLIGVWQASGGLTSGWNDRYQFYKSGAYAFMPNQMQCDKTTIAEAGTWKLTEDTLVLTKKVEDVAVGGKLETASGSCASGKELVNFTEQTNILKTPQIITLPIKYRKMDIYDNYPSVYFGNTTYWKFNDSVDSKDLVPFVGFGDKNCANTTMPCIGTK